MADEKMPPVGQGAPRRGLPTAHDTATMPKGMEEQFAQMRASIGEPGAAMRSAVDGELVTADSPESFTLPSGATARIKRWKGKDLMRAHIMARNMTRNNTEEMAAAVPFALIVCTTSVNGRAVSYNEVLEMDGPDVIELQGRIFAGSNFSPTPTGLPPSSNSGSAPLN